MNDYEFTLEKLHLSSQKEREELEMFLTSHHLSIDLDIETTLVLRHSSTGKIVGTASAAGKVLKGFAISSEFQGEGFTNRLISELIHERAEAGYKNLFVFTKPENSALFQSLGFFELATVPGVVALLENSSTRFQNYLKNLAQNKIEGKSISSIVVNCNPFTLGHRYLIEKASEASDVLHLFVVWENASLFPNEVRFKLVQEGTAHLKNVVLHKGEDYVISKATFPTYFIKSPGKILETHARLDLELFSKYIAPTLGIQKRFVGTEPYCLATSTYNKIMHEILPSHGLSVEEISRKEIHEEAISASRVRELIRTNQIEKCKELIPESTWKFLNSHEAQPIIENIKRTLTRH